jgi:hypothetical protein
MFATRALSAFGALAADWEVIMRLVLLLLSITLLAACGGGNTGKAMAACERELASKAGDKRFEIDRSAMQSGATSETQENGDIHVSIAGPVTFDPGLPKEITQSIECTARFTEAQPEPAVISFVLIW